MMRVSERFAGIPISAKVLAALSVALLPIGVLALVAAFHNYTELRAVHASVTAMQALGIAFPALMWLAALGVAAASLSLLVVRPLRHMAHVVKRYGSGETNARMLDGELASPELAEVSTAFNRMADRAARQADAMAEALATQKALTREVHHRVKNNLQIVSSLLSLQARDANSPEVSAAYALIRQRVNALALVHRWMYHDASAQSVDLRALLADLSANLEHGFEGRAGGGGRVTSSVERLSVGQDTALPIAFLVTELVGAARVGGGTADARIAATARNGVAQLSVQCDAFDDSGTAAFDEGARRIVNGLSRQLRSPLVYDAHMHCFAIEFPAAATPA